MADDGVLIPAATVVLLRDRPEQAGVETLMLRRNSKIAFGGSWVFPGGRVDECDHEIAGPDSSVVEVARVAAVRETEEETGLVITGADLEVWSEWIPPQLADMPGKGPRRRFATWFFVARAPEGAVVIDDGEITEHAWRTPNEARAMRDGGEIELVPPTWVTLFELGDFPTVDSILQAAANRTPERFATQPLGVDPTTLSWAGDQDYTLEGGTGDPGRHRLTMHADGWVYERS